MPLPISVDRLLHGDVVEPTRIELTGDGMTEQVFRGPIQHQLTSALSHIGDHGIQRRTFKHDDTPVAEVVAN